MSEEQKMLERVDRRIWIWLKIRENLEREGCLID